MKTMFSKIKTYNGEIERADISEMEFIPNGMYKELSNLVAKSNEEKIDLINNSSYHHQRPHMVKESTEEFKYPCVQNVNTKNEISCLWYSNTNKKGHFEIPKVIFGRNHSGVIIDESGEYGMAEDCGAIVDETKNLPFILKAMFHPDFLKILKQCDFGGKEDVYNKKVIGVFRKDFWKEFQY